MLPSLPWCTTSSQRNCLNSVIGSCCSIADLSWTSLKLASPYLVVLPHACTMYIKFGTQDMHGVIAHSWLERGTGCNTQVAALERGTGCNTEVAAHRCTQVAGCNTQVATHRCTQHAGCNTQVPTHKHSHAAHRCTSGCITYSFKVRYVWEGDRELWWLPFPAIIITVTAILLLGICSIGVCSAQQLTAINLVVSPLNLTVEIGHPVAAIAQLQEQGLYGCQGHHGSDISWCELVEHIGLWLWLWAVWVWAGLNGYPVNLAHRHMPCTHMQSDKLSLWATVLHASCHAATWPSTVAHT